MPTKLNRIDQFQKDWDKFDFTDMPDYIDKKDLYIEMKIWVRNLKRPRSYYTKSIGSFINIKIKDHKPGKTNGKPRIGTARDFKDRDDIQI